MPNRHAFAAPSLAVIASPNILSPMTASNANVGVAIEKPQHFLQHDQNSSIHNPWLFLNSADVRQTSDVGGIHLDSQANKALVGSLFCLIKDKKYYKLLFNKDFISVNRLKEYFFEVKNDIK